jgi:hypothetical protein
MPDDVDFLFLVTHECVLAPDALERLEQTLRADPRCAVAAPLLGLRNSPNEVWSAGGQVEAWTGRPWHTREPAHMASWQARPPAEVDWLDGAVLLVRADALQREPCTVSAVGSTGSWRRGVASHRRSSCPEGTPDRLVTAHVLPAVGLTTSAVW